MSILPNTQRMPPAPFSILQRTILDILNVNEQDRDIIWGSFENISFTSLETSSNKLAKLGQGGIYIEESLDYILSLTINYIHNIWDNDADFNEVMDSVLGLIRRLLQKEVFLQNSAIYSDKEIFSNLRLSLLDGLIISPTVVPQKLVNKLHEYKISKWTELSEISEVEIIKRFGVNFRSIGLLHCLWLLHPWAETLIEKLIPIINSKQIYCSFESIVEKYILNITNKAQEKEILLRRMGWKKDGNVLPETLGAIAGKVKLTRERVRQIESKLSDRLKHPKSIERAFPLWIIIDSFIQESLGIISFSELAQKLKLFFSWEKIPSAPTLKNLLPFCQEHIIAVDESNEHEDFIISNNFSCNDCTGICDYLLELVSKDDEKEIVDITNSLNNFCKAKCPKEHKSYLGFNQSFVRYILNKNGDLENRIKTKGGKIYSLDKYNLKFGRINIAVETILKQSRRAMHYSEIFKELQKYRPDNHSYSEHNIHAYLSLCQRVLLWDRGAFIHEENVVFPYRLIREIEEWIKIKLSQEIPFVAVSGMFSHFKEMCIHAGITSEYALYSCLKVSGNPLYEYPKFPRVYRSNDDTKRVPLPVVMEEYIKDACGPVSYDDIREYAVNTLHLREFMVLQYLDRAPNVVRIEKREYIHTDYLNIKEQNLSNIVAYAKTILLKEKHISVKKIFNSMEIECKKAGIDNPVILYSLLRLYAVDDFHMQHQHPQILLKSEGDVSKIGILKEVAKYIRNKKSFCTYQELEDNFVKKLGYSEQIVYCASLMKGLYRYLPRCLVHHDTIEWSNEKQSKLEDIATREYTEADLVGESYGLVSFVIEDVSLPKLGNNLDWTETLTADLLSKNKNFKVIGNGRNAFIPFPNKYEIESFEDLLYMILKKQYNGAVDLEDFIEDLQELGIIKKRITKNMLCKSEKVSIIGQEIMLTALIQN